MPRSSPAKNMRRIVHTDFPRYRAAQEVDIRRAAASVQESLGCTGAPSSGIVYETDVMGPRCRRLKKVLTQPSLCGVFCVPLHQQRRPTSTGEMACLRQFISTPLFHVFQSVGTTPKNRRSC